MIANIPQSCILHQTEKGVLIRVNETSFWYAVRFCTFPNDETSPVQVWFADHFEVDAFSEQVNGKRQNERREQLMTLLKDFLVEDSEQKPADEERPAT